MTVAELKQIVERPDLVEMHDVTSMDPKLLVLLKSTRNSGKLDLTMIFKIFRKFVKKCLVDTFVLYSSVYTYLGSLLYIASV